MTLIPVACTIEKVENDGVGGNGGADEKGGSTAVGGATKGGATSNGGSTSVGGSSTIAGASSVAGAAGAAAAGAAGGGGVTSIAGAAGATPIAGATNNAGAAGATSVTPVRVDVDSSLNAAATWKAGHVYVIPSGATIYVNATLTIEAGAIVKFGAGARLYIDSDGQLNAVGTETSRIVFTGIKDDTVGGDTNGDASASKPGLGDWGAVDIYGNSSALDYVDVRYSTNGVSLNGASQSVKHSTFTYNGKGLDAADVDPPASTVVTNNVFYKNTHPIIIDGGTPIDATNLFHNPSAATEVNTFQGISVKFSPTNSVTWSNTEVAYVFPESSASYYLRDPAALTLASGVVLKFGTSSSFIVETGATLNGAATATFTSYKDDIKGDSNGDGTATTPAAGDWDGVRVITSTSDDWLAGANILYATN